MPDSKPASVNRSLTIAILTLLSLNLVFPLLHLPSPAPPPASPAAPAAPAAAAAPGAQRTPFTWLSHLQSGGPARTTRAGCREYDAGAQSCVFSGLACINASAPADRRPEVFLVDDARPDGLPVPHDAWCALRHQSADPRYFSSRHWPILPDTVAPQRSCLAARYRTAASLLGPRSRADAPDAPDAPAAPAAPFDVLLPRARVRWLDHLWLIDLDYASNPHNNHLLKDIIWLLDVSLWHDSLSLPAPAPAPAPEALFAARPRHIYLPQARADFDTQTAPDINRLLWALVLREDLRRLYPATAPIALRAPVSAPRETVSLHRAYPDLARRLVFHRDVVEDPRTDLVCAPRLTVGAKIGNGAHERVCRELRKRAHELYGVADPPKRRLGRVFFPQPPKRIIVLQRHVRRGIGNLRELEAALRKEFEPRAVEVEIRSTAEIATAERQVRLFARAGVLFTPHGGQSMGQLWMPRHR